MQIISGQFKGRVLSSPKGTGTRPTSGRLREALFNICVHKIADARFLDLFAGSGAIGFEALSHGARSTAFVDNNREAIRCIKANVEALELEKSSEVIFGDVFQQLERLAKKGQSFDIIYADPPYDLIVVHGKERMPCCQALLEMLDAGNILAPNGWLFLEDSAKALAEQHPLQHLKAASKRNVGRSTLLQFTR